MAVSSVTSCEDHYYNQAETLLGGLVRILRLCGLYIPPRSWTKTQRSIFAVYCALISFAGLFTIVACLYKLRGLSSLNDDLVIKVIMAISGIVGVLPVQMWFTYKQYDCFLGKLGQLLALRSQCVKTSVLRLITFVISLAAAFGFVLNILLGFLYMFTNLSNNGEMHKYVVPFWEHQMTEAKMFGLYFLNSFSWALLQTAFSAYYIVLLVMSYIMYKHFDFVHKTLIKTLRDKDLLRAGCQLDLDPRDTCTSRVTSCVRVVQGQIRESRDATEYSLFEIVRQDQEMIIDAVSSIDSLFSFYNGITLATFVGK